jgi:hypothetical protein
VEEWTIMKVSEGVNKVSWNSFITFDDYVIVSFSEKPISTLMKSIKSKNHIVSSVEQNKLSLIGSDDKRVVFENCIDPRAYGFIR